MIVASTGYPLAGVRFKVHTESKSLLDLRFSGKVLEVPQLEVEDYTEILFRNMLALEQCHYPYDSYITDYVTIWDFLVNTERDVDLLVRKKVLVNWLGDNDQVAKMFNGLGKNIIVTNFDSHYSQILQNLDDYWKHPCHKWKAGLHRDYCNTPCQTATSIAAILLLFFSLLQSICSVLQVVQQNHASSNT
ncbi:hypothetical protein VNO77_25902 [Canavalia gladiata]|uniref:Uncharacterized protein n=1 Tax=Canavalia gladiata TaxID=3824 RepID=A0AAN9Q5V7_CANGL